MGKKIKILSIFLLIFIGLLLFFSLRQRAINKKSPPISPQTTLWPTFFQRPTFGPVATFTPAISPPLDKEGRIKISNVWVNNFYKAPQGINPSGDVLVADKSEFQIVFLPQFNQFMLSVLASPFSGVRKVAEEEFLKVLGVGRQEACRLNVVVNTPYFANPDYSNQDYPLSFCQK